MDKVSDHIVEPRTIVVVTASNDRQAAAVEQELAARRQAGTFGENVVYYAVPDPSSARVGSGGATFNALLTVEELVSSSTRWRLDSCRIFMIHSGGDSQRLPCQSVCGKAWSALPTFNPQEELDAPIDLLLTTMFKLFKNVRAGLVVASSDVLLLIPPNFPTYWPNIGATGLAIPTDKHIGPNHGVYQVEPKSIDPNDPNARYTSTVSKFWQKATVDEMSAAGAVRSDDTVLIDSGVIYFSPSATLMLLALARTYPLDCCTYLGLDMNRRPLRIELYSDIMMAMGGGMGLTKADYHKVATSDTQLDRIATARDIIWSKLIDMPFYAAVVEGGHFSHVGTTSEYLQLLTRPTSIQKQYGLLTKAAWYEEGKRINNTGICDDNLPITVSPNHHHHHTSTSSTESTSTTTVHAETASFTVLNSLFHSNGLRGEGSVVEHSELSGDWVIGSNALMSSVRSVPHVVVRDGIAIQELRVNGNRHRVITVLGVIDPIKDPYTKSSAVICGAKWSEVFEIANIGPADIWPGIKDVSSMTIWTAKLFPVFPLPGTSPMDQIDSVTADRASLWLQWLHEPTLLNNTLGHDGGTGSSSTSTSSVLHILHQVRRAHLNPKVIQAWKSTTRLSLKDILGEADASIEFAWRRGLRGKIDVNLLVASVAQGGCAPVSNLVKRLGRGAIPVSSLSEGVGTAVSDVATARVQYGGGSVDPASFAIKALTSLDQIAMTSSADIAGRALAVESALLWDMAGWGSHGHRSGPAHNASWLSAFALLDGGYSQTASPDSPLITSNRVAAIKKMAELRDSWIHRAHLMGRAARHYERAAQLLTAQCIYTAPVTTPVLTDKPMEGKWCIATCPVRVDLAGGWSDTPPITFEAPANIELTNLDNSSGLINDNPGTPSSNALLSQLRTKASYGGGMVVNVGIRVDGAQPLGTRVRRTATSAVNPPTITIRTRASIDVEERRSTAAEAIRTGEGGAPGRVVGSVTIRSITDLSDFNQPHAEGALVKCALLCLGVVTLPRYAPDNTLIMGAPDLQTQLLSTVGGSLEVETWSLVPLGSGLGSSSILAGTVLAAIARALGKEYDKDSINHMVLKLEQMLSTGGGWQDQVGGLWPGVKASFCSASLPVIVSVLPLNSSSTTSSGKTNVNDAGNNSPNKANNLLTLSSSIPDINSFLDSHMFLIYTGQTRLAKNLLQRVLRQWAMRENSITHTVMELRNNAVNMTIALTKNDAAAVGKSLSEYWNQKKRMAPMAEPVDVTTIFEVLQPYVYGTSLCGAGGGGFAVGISKQPKAVQQLSQVLRDDPRTSSMKWSIHSATVDQDGLVLSFSD